MGSYKSPLAPPSINKNWWVVDLIMKSVSIIDYGKGNVRSVYNALDYIGVDSVVTKDHAEINNCSHIILPGVGAYGDAMSSIRAYGLDEVLNEQVIKRGKPFLGVCVGMQVLSSVGFEHGEHKGLGWVDAKVTKLEKGPECLKIPHMGWNQINLSFKHPIFRGFSDEMLVFYFVHSFFMQITESEKILASCNYGINFTAGIAWDNIIATQFHPEKSQDAGIEMLKNFVNWAP